MSVLAIHGGQPVRTRPWPPWPQWGSEEQERLQAALQGGIWGGYAPEVAEFEQAFAQRHGATYCIAAANGTLTLVAALMTCGISPGDEVIVPPYTFIATATAVRLVGATPVFVDIDPETYNIDPSAVEAAINQRCRAIIPVHLAGQAVDFDRLLPLAHRHGLVLIEDAAHAHGSTWRGQPVGALGDIGSFSFQTSKNMTAGEGGALTINRPDLAEALRSRVNQGRAPGGAWYEHPNLGSNMRMTAWQAAVLLAQLARLDNQLQRRMANARLLHRSLAEIEGIRPLRWDERADHHAHHLFIMRYNQRAFHGVARAEFVRALQAEGIPCSTGYPAPLYVQPPLGPGFSRITLCPATEQACREAIWLTQNMLLAEPEDVADIVVAIRKIRDHIMELAR
jgi:dTDP-4-amino-4,6-dideoxygalactose transaminase